MVGCGRVGVRVCVREKCARGRETVRAKMTAVFGGIVCCCWIWICCWYAPAAGGGDVEKVDLGAERAGAEGIAVRVELLCVWLGVGVWESEIVCGEYARGRGTKKKRRKERGKTNGTATGQHDRLCGL